MLNLTTEIYRIDTWNAELERQERIAHAQGRFSPNTCPQCGTRWGMHEMLLDLLVNYPPEDGDRFYRDADNDPVDADYVWTTCYVCNPGGALPAGYEELTIDQVEEMIDRYIAGAEKGSTDGTLE